MSNVRQPWLLAKEVLDPGFEQPYCHATTIAETEHGLVVAFFGADAGGRQDLWLMRQKNARWGCAEQLVATAQREDPCWNPVLHQRGDGELLLFYKQGPDCSSWGGLRMRSRDGGATWSRSEALPQGIWGPIRNKPLELADGSLLCPSSTETGAWRVHFETMRDGGETWSSTGPIAEHEAFGAIQPTLIPWPSGRIQALCRSRIGVLVQTLSADGGASWSPLARTDLPNPNSSVDAVLLPDGRALLVYNPTTNAQGLVHAKRTPLSLALSEDGATWRRVADLETADDAFSYPAAIVGKDGLVHVTYTTGRGWSGMRHAVIDPRRLP